MNPSTSLAAVVIDELIRCGVREVVISPGSRSAPLAMEFFRRAELGDLRLSVRIDERSTAFLALGLAKASREPVAIVCTSGTAAAHFHAAVIEADESGVPLLVLTADRPPELRGTGANQTIDQLKLYGSAVRWFCEVGVPEDGAPQRFPGGTTPRIPPQAGYWRSMVARACGLASGKAGGAAGPVHLNLALRDPLVPGVADAEIDAGLGGRDAGAPWTRFRPVARIDWTERGLIVCGDGDYDPAPLLELAQQASWPVLAEPSSNARVGERALSAYQYLIGDAGFLAGHRPDVIVSAGRPGLSRGQLALLRGPSTRHVVLAAGPGRWSDPARTATDVVNGVQLEGRPASGSASPGERPPGTPRRSEWLEGWLDADRAVRRAVDNALDVYGDELSEPRLARDLAALLPDGALLWAASSLPIRDLDAHLAPRSGLRILASRGASGIDGLVSSATGAALAHQAAGGGPAVALLGDLALLHDSPGLWTGPDEPRPQLCLVVINNDGGGIFSQLEQSAFPGPFERVFGTPHGTDLRKLAEAAAMRYAEIKNAADLAQIALADGLTLAEYKSDRPGQSALRAALTRAAGKALRSTS
ncbi:MAG TPA: 2-succinyl-5-enolpyruvyl-6-hydroxy-3-cyclohexene-1-carboxylic-acid synthase [Streptosporangiaceae bacterium]|nr:2-succinyl-5-enolpyruvyl-6-hydroxy-3-cyclohexene-1-carboxylic-acid synthase [Streptosporangiaceae bacterium]